MAQAQTGTGKTAAFAIPILERVQPTKEKGMPQAIVLTPTRELAVQVKDEFVKLAMGRRLGILAVYGGKPLRQQTEQLQRGVDIVIGTPGRVLDHIDRRTLRLDGIRIAVLDEADRMLDIGFRPDIEKILRRCPTSRQTLLFSATIPPPVERLAQRYMREPEKHDLSPTAVAVETIEQFYFTVDGEHKFELLAQLLEKEDPRQAIVFCRTKRGTEKIYTRLARRFSSVATIHGDLPQRKRDKVMADFRQGTLRYLVATDVVGRGIDVTGISHIINYDIPQFADDYVHRVGRTGRMGREGVAYTFVTPEEGNELTRIEMRINRLLVRKETSEYVDLPHRERTASVRPPLEVPASGEDAEAQVPSPPAAPNASRSSAERCAAFAARSNALIRKLPQRPYAAGKSRHLPRFWDRLQVASRRPGAPWRWVPATEPQWAVPGNGTPEWIPRAEPVPAAQRRFSLPRVDTLLPPPYTRPRIVAPSVADAPMMMRSPGMNRRTGIALSALGVCLIGAASAWAEPNKYLGPQEIVASKDGNTLYVLNLDAGQIAVVDLASGKVARSIALPAEPTGLALSPDGKTLYVDLRRAAGNACWWSTRPRARSRRRSRPATRPCARSSPPTASGSTSATASTTTSR